MKLIQFTTVFLSYCIRDILLQTVNVDLNVLKETEQLKLKMDLISEFIRHELYYEINTRHWTFGTTGI